MGGASSSSVSVSPAHSSRQSGGNINIHDNNRNQSRIVDNDDDDDETLDIDPMRNMSHSQLLQRQRDVMREQDDGLDALSAVIAKQKRIGLEISDEVDDQARLIDDIEV